jgi:hypothetical protein
MPIGIASTAATPSPSAQPRTVWTNATQNPPVCTSDHSSRKVVLMDGRSFCEITPVREITSQNASAAAIDSAKTSASVNRLSRKRTPAMYTALTLGFETRVKYR